LVFKTSQEIILPARLINFSKSSEVTSKFKLYRRQIENSRSELTKLRDQIENSRSELTKLRVEIEKIQDELVTMNAQKKDYEKMLSTEQDPSQKKFYQQYLLQVREQINIKGNRVNAKENRMNVKEDGMNAKESQIILIEAQIQAQEDEIGKKSEKR
jgi:predicted  nucleic acid-binding Zn-ribbon protein